MTAPRFSFVLALFTCSFLLAIGNSLGGWVGAKMAVEKGAVFVRWLLIAVVAVSAAQLLGIFDLVTRFF